ncbi:MAG: DUF3050 domain-containing protein [Blastocatellia bacterium]
MREKEMEKSLDGIELAIQPIRERLAAHPLYQSLTTAPGIARFMEHHVWAVWDFMSIVKALQRSLTCVTHPWRPQGDPEVRYLINDIVTGEESDLDRHGRRQSHFEIYLTAMRGIGASTQSIEQFLALLEAGVAVPAALQAAGAPLAAARFVEATMAVVERGRPHEVASLFTFGREEVIPTMFLGILDQLQPPPGTDLDDLRYYLERHVEVDGGHHGPLARRMVELLVGKDPQRLTEAEEVAKAALLGRLALWDAVVDACRQEGRQVRARQAAAALPDR